MTLRRRARVSSDVPARLAALCEALESAPAAVGPETVQHAAATARRATERLRHGSSHTVVALLGATGSGKSSIANALAGADVATTGVRRPTTSSTLALVWGDGPATGLLDWLEVSNRHHVDAGTATALSGGEDRLDGLVVLDVPDHDSVAVAHRLEMERIAAHVDLMVWVTDPEKYADRAMHQYLRRFGGHGAVTLLVLNKADQVGEQAAEIAVDLHRLLASDGLGGSPVVVASASDGTGMAQLRGLLGSAVAERRAMLERLSADITAAADDLLVALGSRSTASASSGAERRLADDLVGAAGIDVVIEAVAAGHRRDAAARTGWPFTRWLRRLRPHPLRRLHLDRGSAGRSSLPSPGTAQTARAVNAIRTTVDTVVDDLEPPWPDHFRRVAIPDESVLRDRLDMAVADAVRFQRSSEPRWWQLVGVMQVCLGLAALVGLGWLFGIAVVGYLQLPALPLPRIGRAPLPTVLAVGGALAGWTLAVLSRRLAALGARRAAGRARRAAADEVGTVARELVLEPLRAELDRRNRMLALLESARGTDG